MPRIIAIDYGQKRTGIAITDELQMIASGLTTIDSKDVILFLKTYFSNETVSEVLIGDPKQMNGKPSESTLIINEFVKQFSYCFPQIKIIRVDERFTSKIAFKTMIYSGLKTNKRKNKALIDEVSATIMLQDYLYQKVLK